MSRSTSKTTSRAMFEKHRADWLRRQMRDRPYIMETVIDSEIPTYEDRDVVLLAAYARRLEAALPEAFDRGREQGRSMERKGI